MPRAIVEWIGKSDDTPPPPRVKLRILHKQNFKCAITGAPIPAGVTPEFDHILALINGGTNSESNLQAVLPEAHKAKTADDVAKKAKADKARKRAHGLKPVPTRKLQGPSFTPSSQKAAREERKAKVGRLPIPPRTHIFGIPIEELEG